MLFFISYDLNKVHVVFIVSIYSHSYTIIQHELYQINSTSIKTWYIYNGQLASSFLCENINICGDSVRNAVIFYKLLMWVQMNGDMFSFFGGLNTQRDLETNRACLVTLLHVFLTWWFVEHCWWWYYRHKATFRVTTALYLHCITFEIKL